MRAMQGRTLVTGLFSSISMTPCLPPRDAFLVNWDRMMARSERR